MANDQGFAIGIDLGTTYCCVAVSRKGLNGNDSVEIIENPETGKRTTPSYVSFTNEECLVGDGAKNHAARSYENLTNTVFDAKRLIGRRYHDQSVQSELALWPFNVVAGEQDSPIIVVQSRGEEKRYFPEGISAKVLSKLKETAESYLGCEVKNAVVTVPAYFNDSQRQSTIMAGKIAGLNVMNVLNEPNAAAIAYGLDLKASGDREKKNVLVFDLGGGTFDVSILEIENGRFQVKATSGDTHLGGEDFNNILVYDFVKKFKEKHNRDIRDSKRSLWRLRSECEKAKISLSSCEETNVTVLSLYGQIDLNEKLTRARFEFLNMDLFVKCIQIVKTCLDEANMRKESIDDVVLVGGSTRIPKVRKLLEEFFDGKKLNDTINADEAVAYGAAIFAAKYGGNEQQKREDFVLLDVTPLSLGVAIKDGLMSVVVPKNTRIPTEIDKQYSTTEDNQTAIVFMVYEGQRGVAKENNFLGKLTIDGISRAPAGHAKVLASFSINRDGILEVSAMNLATGKKVAAVITNCVAHRTKDEIQKMIINGEEYGHADKMFRKRVEARNALESYAQRVLNAVDNLSFWYLQTKKLLKKAARSAIDWSKEHQNDTEMRHDAFDAKRLELENMCRPYNSHLGI